MAHRPTGPVMDHGDNTEFASPRYFDKLRSLNEAAAANASTSDRLTPTTSRTSVENETEHATYTLPVGHGRRPQAPVQRKSDDGVRPNEQKKRTFGHDLVIRRPSLGAVTSVRSKIAHRTPTAGPHTDEGIARRSISETASLYELFHNLPNELQLQIIAPLPLSTVLNLRRASRYFCQLVALNEAPIARYHMNASLPSYARRLYPPPSPSEINLQYVCGVWHRLHVAWKLSQLIAEQTTKEIFLRTTDQQRADFEPQHMRMRQRLMPLVFTIFHFFEQTRDLHARHLAESGIPLHLMPYTLNPIERQVMDLYDDETLLKTHEIFPLVMASFSRRLRPPSYIGRLERSIKGYLKDKPAEEVYTTILAIGGLRQAEKFWDTKGYNARRTAVDNWYGSVIRTPVPVEPTVSKSKMSLLPSFGRKKHAAAVDPLLVENGAGHGAGNCGDWFCVGCSSPELRRRRSRDGALYHSTLSDGPPMGPLPRDQLRSLLADLPLLSEIWLPTGEATILERQIVDGPSKIKRNSQVLMDLIKEDGMVVEFWWPDNSADMERSSSNSHGVDF